MGTNLRDTHAYRLQKCFAAVLAEAHTHAWNVPERRGRQYYY